MELNSISLNDFVKLGEVLFSKGLQSVSEVAKGSGLFNVIDIPANTGESREFSEIDLEEYASHKGESDQASRAKVQQGYKKTMTAYRVAKDIGISYEMRTRNKYPEVMRRLTSLGRLAPNRMDLDMTHRLSFGTATSYIDKDGRTVDVAVGDGLSLFNTTHTVKGSSTTYRNRLANNPQLSRGSLEGMERLVTEETINQFGEKVAIPFDILWVADDPNLINTAQEYLKSSASPDANNAGVTNVYGSKYKLVVLPRLATTAAGLVDTNKRKYWGLASSMGSQAWLGIWEQPRLKSLQTTDAAEEFSTDDWNFGVRAGYGIVILNGAWIKFSSGDGEA